MAVQSQCAKGDRYVRRVLPAGDNGLNATVEGHNTNQSIKQWYL